VLAKVSELEVDADYKKPRLSASAVAGRSEIYVLLEGVIDLDSERRRLGREMEKVEAALERSRKKLSNTDFLERAKPEVVQKEKDRLKQLQSTRAKLERALAALEE